MNFKLIGEIADVETFCTGTSIRELPWLKLAYGAGRWRERKGFARIRFAHGSECRAELHWYEGYEARGLGRKEMKIKRFFGE